MREVRMSEAERERAAGFMDLAWKLAMRFSRRTGIDIDECMSEATDALCTAARNFDAGRGVKFITFAWRAIDSRLAQRRMHGLLQMNVGPKNCTSKHPIRRVRLLSEVTAGRADWRRLELGEAVGPRLGMEEREAIDAALDALSQREREVIEMRYFGGLQQREIGEHIGLTRSRVWQLEGQALRKMGEEMQGEEVRQPPPSRLRRDTSPVAPRVAGGGAGGKTHGRAVCDCSTVAPERRH